MSLPSTANGLRLLGPDAVPVADLPALAGVSKEAMAFMTGLFARSGLAVPDAAGEGRRGKVIRLTDKGCAA